MSDKQLRQALALKSIGVNANNIAKRFGMTGMELKRRIKDAKK